MVININKSHFYIVFFLSLIIFIPRLLDLDIFLNPDGAGPWFNRCLLFYAGIAHLQNYDFTTTLQTAHPGVTLMILSGASMSLAQLIKYGNLNVAEHAHELFFYAKLPIVIVTGLSIIFVYFLFTKYYKKNYFPIIAATLLCVDPYFLAHSRYFQLDALTASFMLLALLTTAVYCQIGNKRYLVLSGVFTGLALLSKIYSVALIPFILPAFAFSRFWNRIPAQEFGLIKTLITWILVTIFTFTLLWPSMWVQPIESINRIIGNATYSVTHTHENSGSLTKNQQGIVGKNLDRGIQLKSELIADFINETPTILLILSTISIFFIIHKIYHRQIDSQTRLIIFLLAFFCYFLFGMSLSGKSGIRYCVISFILFDMLAAYGFVSILSYFKSANINKGLKQVTPVILVLILLTHGIEIFRYHPYYQDFQNRFFYREMMGGAWGEGLEQIGAYLNDKPESENLAVATFYVPVLKNFYKGKTVHLRSVASEKPDYIVLYASQVDRYLFPELVKKYYLNPDQKPEFVARINGHEYAWLYVNRDKYPSNNITPELELGTASINSEPNQ